jgi:RNA polymerase sigma-70 factor (ECF subfamily)
VLGKLRAGEVREPDRIGSFALGTARRMALEMRRDQARQSELEEAPAELPAPPVEAPDPLDLDRLARCMESLTERERTVATLTFYAEQDSAAIANALRTSSGNVRVLRHRAISRLRACMDLEEVHG